MTTARQLIAYLQTIPEDTKITVLHKDNTNLTAPDWYMQANYIGKI